MNASPLDQIPASVRALAPSRRGLMLGGAGVGAAALLAGCGGSSSGGDSKSVTVGSNQSDEIPKKAVAEMMAGFTGGEVKINTIDHATFQQNITNYLQADPDDVFSWFAGYRARYFADQGLVGDLSDVWSKITGMPEAMKAASTDSSGRQIFVPSTYYPWAVFYKPSVFAEHGWSAPTTYDELMALNEQVKAAAMTPFAMADKDGWEAMGTFDILNLRLNGYDFHISLMAGEEAWDGEKVKNVFSAWSDLVPFQQADPLGRTWQEAAQSMLKNESAMYYIGMFVGQQWQESEAPEDLDFFTFPEMDTAIGADVVEAPVDGYMMAAKPKNEAMAKDLLLYISTPEAEAITLKGDPSVIGANDAVDQSGYSALQKKAVELIGSAANLSAFLDRDTRPDFASTVLSPSIQGFLQNPSDIDSILKSIESQKASIFGS